MRQSAQQMYRLSEEYAHVCSLLSEIVEKTSEVPGCPAITAFTQPIASLMDKVMAIAYYWENLGTFESKYADHIEQLSDMIAREVSPFNDIKDTKE